MKIILLKVNKLAVESPKTVILEIFGQRYILKGIEGAEAPKYISSHTLEQGIIQTEF